MGCLEEARQQQGKETREPLPRPGGQPDRYAYEDERNRVSNLFMIFAPLAGGRQGKGPDRRTRGDFAQCLNDIVAGHFAEAAPLVLGSDNLTPHKPAAWDEAFAPAEAPRIREKLEGPYTPTQGRWRDMAESDLRVLQRPCLERRLPEQEMVTREGTAWARERNQPAAKANWPLTTQEAPIKLKQLSPSFLMRQSTRAYSSVLALFSSRT